MTGSYAPDATVIAVDVSSPHESQRGECRQGESLPRDPQSVLLVRVFADRIEVNEHLTHDRTAALFRALRGLGVAGEIIFRTPCG